MAVLRGIVCGAALAIALTPLGAFAADSSAEHMQAELANAQAQWQLSVVQVGDMRKASDESAANERSIALIQSGTLHDSQISEVANSTAMQQNAGGLANIARTDGDVNARNELAIAWIKANALVTIGDANLANAMAQGRVDEIASAEAHAHMVRGMADVISSQIAELNMSSAKLTGEDNADTIHTPALAQEKNGSAMGANDILAADSALVTGQIAASSALVGVNAKALAVSDHASASLANAKAMAGLN